MANFQALARARNLVILAVVDVALFVIANATAKNSSHPGTVSNIAFVAFIVGALLLIAFGSVVLVRRRRAVTGPS